MMHNTILSERVASILAFLSLLSGPVLTSVDPSISGDIGSLLDFAQNPTREKIYRIKSLIRVYAILFAWGVFSSDQNLDRETDEFSCILILLYLIRVFCLHGGNSFPGLSVLSAYGKRWPYRCSAIIGRKRRRAVPGMCYVINRLNPAKPVQSKFYALTETRQFPTKVWVRGCRHPIRVCASELPKRDTTPWLLLFLHFPGTIVPAFPMAGMSCFWLIPLWYILEKRTGAAKIAICTIRSSSAMSTFFPRKRNVRYDFSATCLRQCMDLQKIRLSR